MYKLALDMNKFPVVVKDAPGFIVNRLLGIYMAEAGQMLLEGCDPLKVDKAILDFGMPMGPYRLLDEVGIDVSSHVGPTLNQGLGPRFVISNLLDNLIKEGRLGKKNGQGFYKYDDKGKQGEIDTEVLKRVGLKVDAAFPYSSVVDRCILSMVNEAALILDEGVAASPEDVDLAMVFGTGFSPYRGGLLSYADNRGAQDIVQALEELKAKYGDRFTPAPLLVKMAAEKTVFFPDRPLVPLVEKKPAPVIAYY